MKIHVFFLLFLVALIGSVVGEEAEVNADGSVEQESVQQESVCDCSSAVAEAVGAVANEKEGLLAELNASREQANARGAEIDNIWGQLNAAKEQLAAAEQAAQEARAHAENTAADASKTTQSIEAQLKTMEQQVAVAKAEADAAKKEADEFKSTWAVLNVKRIQVDITNMLKKLGIMKD